MIFRTLQINRQINVNLLEKEVDGTGYLSQSFAGTIGNLKGKECVTGEAAGLDKQGRPYKNWVIANVEKIKKTLKARKIKPLYPEALEIIRGRKADSKP